MLQRHCFQYLSLSHKSMTTQCVLQKYSFTKIMFVINWTHFLGNLWVTVCYCNRKYSKHKTSLNTGLLQKTFICQDSTVISVVKIYCYTDSHTQARHQTQCHSFSLLSSYLLTLNLLWPMEKYSKHKTTNTEKNYTLNTGLLQYTVHLARCNCSRCCQILITVYQAHHQSQ